MTISSSQRYISRELTHFVGRRESDDESRYGLLLKIIREGWLTHEPHNPRISGNLSVNESARVSQNEMYLPQVVCFCDIPLQDLAIHVVKYSRFGISFDKDFICNHGGTPVFYIPVQAKATNYPPDVSEILSESRSRFEALGIKDLVKDDLDMSKGELFDAMVKEYHDLLRVFEGLLMKPPTPSGGTIGAYPGEGLRLTQRLVRLAMFLDFHVFSRMVFFSHLLPEEDRQNYYFEREWRVVGNVPFKTEDIRRILIPEAYAKRFRQDCPQYCGQLSFVE
jgi:hypothetical protein